MGALTEPFNLALLSLALVIFLIAAWLYSE